MKTFRNILLAGAAIAAVSACGEATEPTTVGTTDSSDPATETFRQALPSADDVSMEYADAAAGSATALKGQYSLIAGLTAEAVIGTNTFMIGHFAMMKRVANLPPTAQGEDFRVWQGEHEDLTIRVRADRSDTPRGTRYDYKVAGKLTASTDDFLPIIDGHVVRLDQQYEPRDGFGIVRFHFTNVNTLQPERDIAGIARVAFRKANRAHQVRVRALGVETPEDPQFPKAAEYAYAVKPNTAGALRWFSKSDVKQDSQPLENVAVHSAWRADKSGVGSAVVFGGSLEVDYWHLAECWDNTFVKSYDRLSTPDNEFESGDRSSCLRTPEDLDVPAHQEDLPNEDPAIPAPMDEEGN